MRAETEIIGGTARSFGCRNGFYPHIPVGSVPPPPMSLPASGEITERFSIRGRVRASIAFVVTLPIESPAAVTVSFVVSFDGHG